MQDNPDSKECNQGYRVAASAKPGDEPRSRSIAISVIMPTYNSARYLRRCLETFRQQTFEDWALICVDRGSSDGTLDILAEYARDWDKLRVLNGGDERTSQINVGVRSSESKYIYYTASDFDVDPRLLEEAFEAAERDSADGVYITNVSFGQHLWARVRNLERRTYENSISFEAARFLRRSSYLAAGGYDDGVPIFEEYDLQDRMRSAGASFTRIAAVERHLGEPETLGEIWRKSFYYGQRYRDLLEKQGRAALRHVNPVRGTFFRHWRDFAVEPVLSGAFLVMLATKYIGGACGLLTTLLPTKPKRPRF